MFVFTILFVICLFRHVNYCIILFIRPHATPLYVFGFVWFMVFNATFNTIAFGGKFYWWRQKTQKKFLNEEKRYKCYCTYSKYFT
jgi:hypothetical protein